MLTRRTVGIGLAASVGAALVPGDGTAQPRALADASVAPLKPVAGRPLPAWRYGHSSVAADTVLMFRGNGSHTFYGTGAIPETAPQVRWRHRTATIDNVVRGVPTRWAGTGWTGTAVKLGGYVYVGSVGGVAYAYEAMTGRVIWEVKAGGMYKSSFCAFENRLYIGNTDDKLRCLDAATGARLWTVDTGNDLDSSPCVIDGRLYIAGENGHVRCLDPATGREHWKTFIGGIGPGTVPGSNGSECSPAIADGELYTATYDGVLFCLDLKSGRVRWKAKTHDDTDASQVIADEFVYAASEEQVSNVYCFARDNGREVWRYGANKRGFWSTPAIADGRLYIGGDDAQLHCVDARSGKGLWTYKTGDAIWSSPCVVDGKVIFGGRDGYVYCLDAARGTLIWRLKLDGRIISSPLIVDGVIWIGTATGMFYCLAA
jgi:eukaryotic-like serine/threonine-protein kinase